MRLVCKLAQNYITMKTLALILGVLAYSNASLSPHSLHLRAKFKDFVEKHNKVYETPAHYEERFAIFSENVNEIEKHNSENHSWRKAINQFADLTGIGSLSF